MKFILILTSTLFLMSLVRAQDTLSLYYGINKYKLEKTHKAYIEDKLVSKEVISVSINGYTDYLGSKEYNMKLSKRRADEVWNYLKSKNVLSAVANGNGETGKTLNSNAGIRENRRVDIIYKVKPKSNLVTTESSKDTFSLDVDQLKVGDKIVLKNFNFIGGRHYLIAESKPELSRLIDIMLKHPTLKIELHGHICCETDHDDGWDVDEMNYKLSINRAKYIYDQLVKHGVKEDRLKYKGFGRSAPLHPLELDEVQKQANRRVEILIVEK